MRESDRRLEAETIDRDKGWGARATDTSRDSSSGSSRKPSSWRRHFLVVLALAGFTLLVSCERTPSKSDYVSAQVTALCAGQTGNELRACRLAVINQFADTPLEEMQRRFPPPEPKPRPSCGF